MQSDSQFAPNDTLDGRWLQEEHQNFLIGLMKYGKNWKEVEEIVKSRKGPQIRSHAQKFFLKVNSFIKEKRKFQTSEKQIMMVSDVETELLTLFSEKDITKNTPIELIAIIRQDWNLLPPSKKKNNKSKKLLKQSSNEEGQKNSEGRQPSSHEMKNQNDRDQVLDESYFVKLLKFNSDFFPYEQAEHSHPQLKETSKFSSTNNHQLSFTLPEGEANLQYSIRKERIEKIHKFIGSPQEQSL